MRVTRISSLTEDSQRLGCRFPAKCCSRCSQPQNEPSRRPAKYAARRGESWRVRTTDSGRWGGIPNHVKALIRMHRPSVIVIRPVVRFAGS